MNRKASTTLIGAFVAGAVILVVSGLLIFGGGKLFKESNEYALFFEGSVKGLTVGAPVLFSGVTIGSVKSISIEYNAETLDICVPVIVEISGGRFQVIKGNVTRTDAELLHRWIQKGLRAQLGMESFITGQLYVEMDYRPDTPVNVRGLDKKHLEIPTIPSTFQRIYDVVKTLPLADFLENIQKAAAALEKILASPEIPETLRSLNAALQDTRNLIQHVDGRVDPLAGALRNTMTAYKKLATHVNAEVGPLADNARGAISDAREVLGKTDKEIEMMGKRIEKALKASHEALEQAEGTLAVIEKRVGKDSPVLNQFSNTLREFSEMARSIRSFVNYLSRHPEALIRGKHIPSRR